VLRLKQPLCLVCDASGAKQAKGDEWAAHVEREHAFQTEADSAKAARLRAKLLRHLWQLDAEPVSEKARTWQETFEHETKPRDVRRKHRHEHGETVQKDSKDGQRHRESKTKVKEEVIDKNLSESISLKHIDKKKIGSKQESRESRDLRSAKDEKRVAVVNEANKERAKSVDTENDIFIEVIIDELSNENRELKFALLAHDEQLKRAADKVKEMVEENARLSQRLEKALSRATEHAANLEGEMSDRIAGYEEKTAALKDRIRVLESSVIASKATSDSDAVVALLTRQLEESEARCRGLTEYVATIKQAYSDMFEKEGGL
jgi:hypothetical protein